MGSAGKTLEQEADHGEADKGGDSSGVALKIAHQGTIAADPGEGPLDDPLLGEPIPHLKWQCAVLVGGRSFGIAFQWQPAEPT